MLDINLFRPDKGGDLELVRASQRKRFTDVSAVDRVADLDAAWRQASFEREQLSKKFNALNREVAAARKAGQATEALHKRAQELRAAAALAAEREEAAARVRDAALCAIGNLVAAEVPVSNDEKQNAVIGHHGPPPRTAAAGEVQPAPGSTPGSTPSITASSTSSSTSGSTQSSTSAKLASHPDLLAAAGIADLESGVAAAGGRGYYLLNEGVLLNQALVSYGLSFLAGRGWSPVQTPAWLGQDVMSECAQLSEFDDELYKVSGSEDDSTGGTVGDSGTTSSTKYLIATSEQALCAMLRGAWLEPCDLPLKYAGISPCFRREVGSHGRDTLGIFRVHQFDKVEQFGVTPPDPAASRAMLDDMLRNASDFYTSLGIPHRLVRIVSGALNNAAASKVDLEAWFPASQTYRELVSGSNCTDYQARRLGIRLRPSTSPTPPPPKGPTSKDSKAAAAKPGSSTAHVAGSTGGTGGVPPSPFVHMLNCTLTATQRTMCAIMENHQTREGFWVPAPLRAFMGGLEFVKFRRPLGAPAGRLLASTLRHSGVGGRK